MAKRTAESAKRTDENSPAIYRWERIRILSLSPQSGRLNQASRALCGSPVRYADSLTSFNRNPSTEVAVSKLRKADDPQTLMSFEQSPLNTEPRAVATGSYTQLTIDRGSIGVEWPHPVATARGSVLSGDVACTYRSDFLHGLSFDTASEPFRTGWAAKAARPRVRFLNLPTFDRHTVLFSHDA